MPPVAPGSARDVVWPSRSAKPTATGHLRSPTAQAEAERGLCGGIRPRSVTGPLVHTVAGWSICLEFDPHRWITDVDVTTRWVRESLLENRVPYSRGQSAPAAAPFSPGVSIIWKAVILLPDLHVEPGLFCEAQIC